MIKTSNFKRAIEIVFVLLLAMIVVVSFFATNAFARGASAENCVAKVVIFSVAGQDSSTSSGSSSSIADMGHAFILIENKSDGNITVGKMVISENSCVTIGTWGNKNAHKGLWYNLENYAVNANHGYIGRVSLEQSVTESELLIINTYINQHDSWTLFSNCSTFATGLWNSFSSIQLSCGWINTPANLKKSIMQHSYTLNRTFGYNERVGYYSGNTFVSNNPFGVKGLTNWATSFTYDEYITLCEMGVQ